MGVHDAARGYECTEAVLVLYVGLGDIDAPAGPALASWFVDHGVDPHLVASGHPVERMPELCCLVWRCTVDGDLVVVRRFGPQLPGSWPAPFPEVVLTGAGNTRCTGCSCSAGPGSTRCTG